MIVHETVFTLYDDDLENHQGSARKAVEHKLALKHPDADEIEIDQLEVTDDRQYKVAAVTYTVYK